LAASIVAAMTTIAQGAPRNSTVMPRMLK
jgi:hypothetical protein